jgi:teichoic acid transport system permease protein
VIDAVWQDFRRYGRILGALAFNDFRTRYAGSQLGIFWAFVPPLVTVLVFWFVFRVGMRTIEVDGVPFLVWLVCGLVPWFFFADAWTSATNSLFEYSYLVKKVVFRVSFLPLVKVGSSLFVHAFFIVLMLLLCGVFGISIAGPVIQILYYSFALVALVTALSLLTVSVAPFFRDVTQLLAVMLQVGMWGTPIMWSPDRIPENFRWVLAINPMCYVIEGYRGAVLRGEWFWERPLQTLFFWLTVLVLGVVGGLVYRRLRPHFADVL